MTSLTHTAWCTDHVETDPGAPGLCQAKLYSNGIELTLDVDEANPGQPQLEIYSASSTYFTADEAREAAAAILRAADAMEAHR